MNIKGDSQSAAERPSRRHAPWITALFFMHVSAAFAADGALAALEAIPAEDRGRLARIEGPAAAPNPERWYFDVFSKESDSGVREYVVVQRQIVARRNVSQFVSDLTAKDVLDAKFIRVDSTKVAGIARDYAKANGEEIASMNFTLGKPIPDARPMWRVRCFDADGAVFGTLLVAAENGTVFTHAGFQNEPGSLPSSARMEIADAGAARIRSPRQRKDGRTPDPIFQGPRKGSRSPGGAQSRAAASTPAPVRNFWQRLFAH